MSKDMEYYKFEGKIEEIKTKAKKSKNEQYIQQCIGEISDLYKELDGSKQNENYEIYNLVNDTCKELSLYKKDFE